jgi:DNA-binding transcriptional MerR regulator
MVSAPQLAEWFDVSLQTIHRWAEKGILPQPVRYSPRIFRFETLKVRGYLRRVEEAAEQLDAAMLAR